MPGTAKAPEALREAGLHRRMAQLGTIDAGVVLPGRYVDDDGTRAPGQVRNQSAVIDHARRLARRLVDLRAAGHLPVVIGGDCSLLIAAGLALSGGPGTGLVHVDGHTDFRHPGNSTDYGALAGEDLAAAVGRHLPAVADIDGQGPYFDPRRTVHIGCRDSDQHLHEARTVLGDVITASDVLATGGTAAAQRARSSPGLDDGYWVQVDVDVLDPTHMPAVDSPDAGGLAPQHLVDLLQGLLPWARGVSVTVFDPDLDPDGHHAATLVTVLEATLPHLGSRLH